jgi:hypothetical protein
VQVPPGPGRAAGGLPAGEPFPRVDWVAVPRALPARRANSSSRERVEVVSVQLTNTRRGGRTFTVQLPTDDFQRLNEAFLERIRAVRACLVAVLSWACPSSWGVWGGA